MQYVLLYCTVLYCIAQYNTLKLRHYRMKDIRLRPSQRPLSAQITEYYGVVAGIEFAGNYMCGIAG